MDGFWSMITAADLTAEDGLPKTGFVRLPAVLTIIPVSKSTWWDGVKKGKFPKPVKFGKGITAWDVNSIRLLRDAMN